MARYPQYTTFQPGELEAALKTLRRGATDAPSPPRENADVQECPARIIRSSPTGLILEAECPVTFPDAVKGTMRYERRGPKEHLLHYFHASQTLAYIVFNGEIPAGPAAFCLQFLAEKAWEYAVDAYDLAVERERKGYFMRATEDEGGNRVRRKDVGLPGITAAMAKTLSGMYALCEYRQDHLQTRGNLLTDHFKTLAEANRAFDAMADASLRVCCFNRLDRCWEIPRLNPLYYWPGTNAWQKR